MPLQPQRINIPIGGGLQGDETPEYIDPPALFECQNLYHNTKSSLTKRKGYWQRSLRVDPGTDTGGEPSGWAGGWPEVPLPIPNPLQTGLGFDRFLLAGNNVVAAGAGYLWGYDPGLFAHSTETRPPNGTRIAEIPDVAIKDQQIKGIVDAQFGPFVNSISERYNVAAGAMNQDGLVVSTYIREPGIPDTISEEWHCRINDPNDSSIDYDIIVAGEGKTLSNFTNPICLWCDEGAVVAIACLAGVQPIVVMQWFSLKTMRWASSNRVFPTSIPPYDSALLYDMALQDPTTNTVVMAWINDVGQIAIASIHADTYVHDRFVSHVTSSPIGYTGTAPIPGFSVACSPAGEIAVALSVPVDGNIELQIFSSAGVLLGGGAVATGVTSASVSVTSVAPVGSSTARWVVSWLESASFVPSTVFSIGAGTVIRGSVGNRNCVYARAFDDIGATVGPLKLYPSTSPISSLFGIGGSAYQILRADVAQTITTVQLVINDEPWVLVRPFSELDQGDLQSAQLARPMAAWGYGRGISFAQPPKVTLISPGSKRAAGVFLGAILDKLQGDRQFLEVFDQGSIDRYDSVPLPNGGSFFGCATPWVFDGSTAFEAAFITKPIFSAVIMDEFDGNPSNGARLTRYTPGDYQFKAVFLHQDIAGRVTYSAPSDTLNLTIPDPTGGDVNNTGADGNSDWRNLRTLVISGLFLTARPPGSMTLALYVSNDNINFAQLISVPIPAFNPNLATPLAPLDVVIPLNSTHTYGSTGAGNSLLTFPLPAFSSPTIYTQDGTLPSDYPQLASHVVRWNNRIWIANGHEITHSHEFVEGDQPSFPLDFHEYLDRNVTAISPLDDRVLLFSEDAILYRSGEGPSPSGQNSSYSNWNFITHELGTVNSRSVVHTPTGVYFQSRRGIEWMSPDGSVNHVRALDTVFRAGSDPGVSDAILGVMSLPRDRQLRILYGSYADQTLGILVLDYWTNTWSTWDWQQNNAFSRGVFGGDITVIADQVYMVTADGVILIEQTQQYDTIEDIDNDMLLNTNLHINWSIETPWIKTDGIQGFERIWRTTSMFKCGSWGGATLPKPVLGITTSVAVDYGELTESHGTKSINELKTLRSALAGGLTYLTIGHKNQSCRSYQLRLSSSDSTSRIGVDVSGVTEILGFWSEIGIEPGTGRGPAAGRI